MVEADTSADEKIIVYAHPTCPMFYPVRSALESAKVPYEYINIREDESARLRVREINDGYESVPTLVFPDGSTLTEPTTSQLSDKISRMGYELGIMGWIKGNALWLATGAVVLYGVLQFLDVI
ncbi:glutathione S-transferase N-terminal domain-containing protein [Phototrophicus methaneseepsis]|uniref:Glutathione S-transferase N-terminal domain-containing protein n=1 Tax=Phototrophicus methaneseepsis TaxID=2710758 RepID=A0A7S8E9K4_9CHLR|nr:glutaredoxin domain-containing protein [Phototrophicus methaneseepsis]QPC82763.1 glutathione S-transferase N-terminal domain-containing protein [Phototrophicus methaneseepsis]